MRFTTKHVLVLVFAGVVCGVAAAGDNTSSGVLADDAGKLLYSENCSGCHDSGVGEAPLRPALERLTSDRILDALETGIMQAQSAHLSAEDRKLIASYLSRGVSEVIAGSSVACAAVQRNFDLGGEVKVARWGFGSGNRRQQDGSLIDEANVGSLELDWVFAFPNAGRARVQPTIAGDTLFTADQNGIIYALDVETGCELWQFQADAEVRSVIALDTGANGEATTLYFGDFAAEVYALDVATRRLLWRRKIDNFPVATITGSLSLAGDRIIVPLSSLEVVSAIDENYACCRFRGAVVALDKMTGDMLWKYYTVPLPQSRGVRENGIEKFGPSGAPVWTSPTIDEKRGLVYFGTGENYSRPATDTSDAIIALDLNDGSVRWITQALKDDVWNAACGWEDKTNCPVNKGPDYDFGAPPVLARLPGGRELLLAGQKSGRVYALSPEGGQIIWQRQVGRGGIMGGIHWGMASDGTILYVPVSDISVYPEDSHLAPQSGLHAIDVETGDPIWSTLNPDVCGDVSWRCSPGISAAVTLVNGLVFGGGLDGILRAYSSRDGSVLWEVETNRKFEAVNGVDAEGGAIESDGPVVMNDRLFVTSGYDKFGQKFGNVLLSFKLNSDASGPGRP